MAVFAGGAPSPIWRPSAPTPERTCSMSSSRSSTRRSSRRTARATGSACCRRSASTRASGSRPRVRHARSRCGTPAGTPSSHARSGTASRAPISSDPSSAESPRRATCSHRIAAELDADREFCIAAFCHGFGLGEVDLEAGLRRARESIERSRAVGFTWAEGFALSLDGVLHSGWGRPRHGADEVLGGAEDPAPHRRRGRSRPVAQRPRAAGLPARRPGRRPRAPPRVPGRVRSDR
jgi:hypothetical protein